MAIIKDKLKVERWGWQAAAAAWDMGTDGGSRFQGVDPVVDSGVGGADGVLSHFPYVHFAKLFTY